MSRNPVITGLAFLGGFFLVLFILFVLGIFLLWHGKPDIYSGPKIGVVKIVGVISSSDRILKDLEDFKEDQDVKAILVRIDSPGGTVGAAQEIYEAIKEARSVKPVVVSMGSVAASGGLYAALGATKILAMPGTLTGSIGVMMQVPNLQKLLERLGVQATVLKSGPYKDAGSIFRPLTPAEKKILMSTIEDIYRQFVEAIVSSRHLPRQKVLQFADGRVFTGRKALEYGLIDELGNFEKAVRVASDLAGLKQRPTLVYPSRERSLVRRILGEDFRSEALSLYFAPLYLSFIGH